MTAIDYEYLRFGKPNQSHGLRAVASDAVYSIDLPAVVNLQMFDSIPPWFSKLTDLKPSDRYITSPMPFGLTADEAPALAGSVHGVRAARDVSLPPGRGLWRFAAWPPLDRVGLLRRNRPSITLPEFG